jgi:putative hydrolase of the HAD superfamily
MEYKHIFFDLDHTLWDFEKASEETLTDLYKEHQLANFGVELQPFLKTFAQVNASLWSKYNVGKITRDEIREERFQLILSGLGVDPKPLYKPLSKEYLTMCPTKSYVLPYTFEVLNHLKNEEYQLHILTNGFEDVQNTKLKASGLDSYFDVVVTSDHTGYKKPDPRIFEYALKQVDAKVRDCIMIGDGLDTDIIGAQNVAMDHVFYNQKAKKHSLHVTYEVNCLSEIKKIL